MGPGCCSTSRSSPAWRSRLARWVSAVLLTLVALTGAVSLMRLAVALLSSAPQLDFGVYYLGGSILESSDPSDLFSIDRLEKEAVARGLTEYGTIFHGMHYDYPPFLAVLMRSVSRLPYKIAASGWRLLNVLLILMTVPPLAAWYRCRRPGVGVHLVILFVVMLYTPGHSALMLGQVSTLMACALSWAFGLLVSPTLAGKRAAQIAAGWLIGLASIIKLFPVLLIPFLLWRRSFRVAGWAVASLIVYIIVGLVGGGVANTVEFLSAFLPSFYDQRVYHSLDYNQALSATLVRWLGPGALVPPLHLAFSGAILAATCFALVRSRRAMQDDERFGLEYGLVLTASILPLTYVTLNYYLLLLIPLAGLWFSSASRLLRVGSALGCIALICVHSLVMWTFWDIGRLVPFGLIAALLLWGVLVALVSRPPRPDGPHTPRVQWH
jgi:hypothetical protein